ncbi:MAG: LysR family transcriptional regulator [Peptococcaceae bacterium]|nr:LysR family transcriptional regulator [Peptococcaceae bacterium]
MVKIESLAYFLDVCETQSLNQSARRLFLTQPGLTKSIQKLEDEIGVPLFERTQSGVFLTPSGKAFRPYAEKIVTTYKEAITGASQLCAFSQPLNIFTQPIFSELCMSLFLNDLFKRFPNLEVNLVDNLTWTERKNMFSFIEDRPCNSIMLVSGILSEFGTQLEHYNVVSLGTEDTVVYMNKHHPFRRKKEMTYDFLVEHNAEVCFWNNPYFNPMLLQTNFSSVSNLTILKNMILKRDFLVCFPPQIGDRIFQNEEVIHLPLRGFDSVHYMLVFSDALSKEFYPALRLLKNDALNFFAGNEPV